MQDDLALVGGRIRTLDAADTVAEAVLILGGRVAVVGDAEEVRAAAPDGVEAIELDGRTVLPGFIDAHTHLELGARAEEEWVDVRFLEPAVTLERLAAVVRDRPSRDWVVAQGTFGQPLPSRAELDRVAPRHAVVIRQSMHRQVVNSEALRRAGIDRELVPPVGIRVYRDAEGEPTGEIDEGFDLFPVPVPGVAWFEEVLPRQARLSFVRHGVTTIHELPASREAIAAWQRLDARGAMPCRLTLNPILAPGHQATLRSVDDFVHPGFTTGFGSDWLRIGAVKLFLDGAGDAAWTSEQLGGPPSEWGLAPFAFNELLDVLGRCRRSDVQVWMHAVGDVAQSLALDAVEATNRAHPGVPHRTRVEHIGNEHNDPRALARVKAAGIVPVPTAAFMHGMPITPELADQDPYPYRTMLDAGLTLPGNSDSAGTQPFATNPWHGIWSIATRSNGHGGTLPHPEQALSVAEAVRLYTHHGANATFEEHRKGSLEAGRLADLAVYATDPFELPLDDLPELTADMTIVGGIIVHEEDAAA